MNFRPTWVDIDLRALAQNYRALQSLAKSDFFCPMVKANAYGHGVVRVAQSLRELGCLHLGVALIEEGIELRNSGDMKEVLVFSPFDLSGAKALVQNRLIPVVSDWEQLEHIDEALKTFAKKEAFSVHLEFNTGMNRLGFDPSAAEKLSEWLVSHPFIKVTGVATHLLQGHDISELDGFSAKQLNKFEKIKKTFPKAVFHALNSDGLVFAKNSHLGVRPGIALYGIGADSSFDMNLRPVLNWKTRFVQTRLVKKGEVVSYNATFCAQRDMKIGVLPVGYADGYRRELSNHGYVLVGSKRCRVVGTVCMDYTMVDVTDFSNPIQIGEEAILIGRQGDEQVRATELAELCGTISYEILTGVSQRVPREYLA